MDRMNEFIYHFELSNWIKEEENMNEIEYSDGRI